MLCASWRAGELASWLQELSWLNIGWERRCTRARIRRETCIADLVSVPGERDRSGWNGWLEVSKLWLSTLKFKDEVDRCTNLYENYQEREAGANDFQGPVKKLTRCQRLRGEANSGPCREPEPREALPEQASLSTVDMRTMRIRSHKTEPG